MVGNVQRSSHTPSLNLNATYEDPVGVHSQAAAAPRRSSGRIRRHITLRLEKLARVYTLLSRECIEVAENDGWHSCRFRLGCDYFELFQLPVDRRVRIDVRVEEA